MYIGTNAQNHYAHERNSSPKLLKLRLMPEDPNEDSVMMIDF